MWVLDMRGPPLRLFTDASFVQKLRLMAQGFGPEKGRIAFPLANYSRIKPPRL